MEQLHVYRLTDDSVPIVVISAGPLPPPRSLGPRPTRELIGIYDTLADARDAASRVREAGQSAQA
jgi:hypothetical protein